MLKKIKSILNTYVEDYNKFTEEFNKKNDYLNKNYIGGGERYISKLKEIKEAYDVKVKDSRDKALRESKEHFENVLSKLRNKITEGITQEMVLELDLLRKITPTEDDIKAFLNKYKNSYLGCKVLKEIASEKKIDIEIVTLNDNIEIIEDLREKVINVINGYSGPYLIYAHELIIQGDYIDKIEEEIKRFTKEYEIASVSEGIY